MNLNETQDRIIYDLNGIEDWLDKYEYLLEQGRKLEALENCFKVESNQVRGCQSSVWLHPECIDGKMHYTADSDTLITKGMIALLLDVLNHRQPRDIVDADLYFIRKTGLSTHLSPSRANGLAAIVNEMKRYAGDYLDLDGKESPFAGQ